MGSRLFMVSLMAVVFCIHLLRFPHLILSHGGGAYLILFFLVLNLFTFPMLVVERVLDRKLKSIDIASLINVNKSSNVGKRDRVFVFFWVLLRTLMLFSFLWFFLYLGSSSLVYLIHYVKASLEVRSGFSDIPAVPDLEFSLVGALFWSGLSYAVFVRAGQTFFALFARWVLPFCFLILFFLLLRIMMDVSDPQGFRVLFYPDFSALTVGSLNSVIGHSLVCLLIGFGLFKPFFRSNQDVDPIEVFIRSILIALVLAVSIGLMALPMIEQVREVPFGSNWVFEILPRWLSYRPFGNYYTSLFFLALSLLNFYVGLLLYRAVQENRRLLYRFRRRSKVKIAGNLALVWVNASVILLLQSTLQGWSGQSLLLSVDHILVDILLPSFALMMIWVVFRHTKRSERLAVFQHQQVFFHNRVFFNVWQGMAFVLIPILTFAGWFFLFF